MTDPVYDKIQSLKKEAAQISPEGFEELAIRVFRFQARHNPVYKAYLEHLGRQIKGVSHLEQIPFLPIEFFKKHEIKTGSWLTQMVFESSRTTGSQASSHYVEDMKYYQTLARQGFERFLGPCTDWHILALIPVPSGKGNSSLVTMVSTLVYHSNSDHSSFHMNLETELVPALHKALEAKRKVMLWGVTYTLLELVETCQVDLSQVVVVETGGMKGRGKERTRSEVHEILREKGNANMIYSEYGMSELYSQAYMVAQDYFEPVPTLRVLIREANDPFSYTEHTGGINVIDLANIHSCAFIETKDLGRKRGELGFEVLGRFDNSDLRGCNLMAI